MVAILSRGTVASTSGRQAALCRDAADHRLTAHRTAYRERATTSDDGYRAGHRRRHTTRTSRRNCSRSCAGRGTTPALDVSHRWPRRRTTPPGAPRCPPRSRARHWSSRPAASRYGPTTPIYPFRPGTDFVWLTGEHDPDAVLVMRPAGGGHDATLYVRPALAPRHRRVLPRPRPTASCGSAGGTRSRRSPPSWASPPRTWTTLAAVLGRLRSGAHPDAARPRRRRWTGAIGVLRRRRRRPRAGDHAVRAAAGQGRVGDRPAAGRDRRDRPRLRGRRPDPAGRPAGLRAPARRRVRPARAARRQRRRLQLDRRRRRARARSCTGSATPARTAPGRAAADGHGRGEPRRSTPPT